MRDAAIRYHLYRCSFPWAKGCVEPLFRPLQDRLIVELRLTEACSCEQANCVLQANLPKFNTQFAVSAAQEQVEYRPVEGSMKLEEV